MRKASIAAALISACLAMPSLALAAGGSSGGGGSAGGSAASSAAGSMGGAGAPGSAGAPSPGLGGAPGQAASPGSVGQVVSPEQHGGSTANDATVTGGHHRATRDARQCLGHRGARVLCDANTRSWRCSRISGVSRITWTIRQSEQCDGSARNGAIVIGGHHKRNRDARSCLERCTGRGCQRRQSHRAVGRSRIDCDRRRWWWCGINGARHQPE